MYSWSNVGLVLYVVCIVQLIMIAEAAKSGPLRYTAVVPKISNIFRSTYCEDSAYVFPLYCLAQIIFARQCCV